LSLSVASSPLRVHHSSCLHLVLYAIVALFLSKGLFSPSFLFMCFVFHLLPFGVYLELDGILFLLQIIFRTYFDGK
jgi:hypothetical protein